MSELRAKDSIHKVVIESVDLDANGVTHVDGKVMFVRGALIGEHTTVRVVRSKAKFDVAEIVSIEKESSLRVKPRCPNYGVCGGCSMQHIDASAQVSMKQRALEDNLWHLGRVKPESVLRPISGPAWGYRYRARLSIRDVFKKGKVLVGFHEKNSSYVADMTSCEILPKRVSDLLVPIGTLVEGLSIRQRVPQVELAIGEKAGETAGETASELVIALVFRVLEAPSGSDMQRLADFEREQGVELWLQPKGPETVERLNKAPSLLAYPLAEFGLTMPFKPTDFTQVNHQINQVLVSKALSLLDVRPEHRVLDLFCGLGNFTLPLATKAAKVLGSEGSAQLTRRAKDAATSAGLADKCEFVTENLFKFDQARWADMKGAQGFDRLLIDPPREGALEVAKVLAEDSQKVGRIVYVSCNPSTLARDAGILVNTGGYRLVSAGAVNMFPHTAHVESMAVFEPA